MHHMSRCTLCTTKAVDDDRYRRVAHTGYKYTQENREDIAAIITSRYPRHVEIAAALRAAKAHEIVVKYKSPGPLFLDIT